jgi:glycosyltransferase involved in cell wall biosynthesis
MTRILHVLTTPRAEGTPRLVLDWLTEPGYEQGVLFLSPEPAQLNEQFMRACRWVRFGRRFGKAPVKHWQIVDLTRRSVKEFEPDLVIAWPAGWSYLIHLGSRLGGNPRLLTHAGTSPGTGFGRFHKTWICFGIGWVCGHRVVACSRYVQAAFTALPFITEEHVRFAYNCSNVARFLMPQRDATRIANRVCMVGSLERSKDYPNLLRAWQTVEQVGQYELWIAGGGSIREELEALTLKLGLKSVRFLGAIENVPALLWSSTIFAFSANLEEGFGTVLIEALAAGCSVIATDVPACREVLQGGKYGMLVPPQDPEAMASAILGQLHAPKCASEIDEGVVYAKGFTVGGMIRSYLGIAFDPARGVAASAPPPVVVSERDGRRRE